MKHYCGFKKTEIILQDCETCENTTCWATIDIPHNCETCMIEETICPYNQPPVIDGAEELDSYKHIRLDCPHWVEPKLPKLEE